MSVLGTIYRDSIIFTAVRSAGEEPATRNVWVRTGEDAFRVVEQRRSGENWTDGLRVTYRRLR